MLIFCYNLLLLQLLKWNFYVPILVHFTREYTHIIDFVNLLQKETRSWAESEGIPTQASQNQATLMHIHQCISFLSFLFSLLSSFPTFHPLLYLSFYLKFN
jgi:hypothetical protein